MVRNDGFVSRFEISGAPTGPLTGTTFGAKDVFDIQGHVTGAGNPEWARTHEPACENAAAVDALLQAGARLLGKTHSDELAYSLSGVNHHYGAPANPAAPDRVAGGSSSGSASATAAGLIDIGLGSDAAGSVRLPASLCGLYGVRPSHNAIATDGLIPMAPSFDTIGWMTRDADLCIRAASAFELEAEDVGELPEICTPSEPWESASAESCAALREAGERIGLELRADMSQRLTEDGLGQWREAFRTHQAWEIWRVHGAWIEAHNPEFGPGVRERFERARNISDEAAAEAHSVREAAGKRLRDALQGDRILAIPTCPGPALRYGVDIAEIEKYRRHAVDMLCIAGLAGLPQVTIPLAAVDGAPVGLSLIASAGEDQMLLGVVKLLAQRIAAA